jgi:SNF2 family DNA or RNA helicase
VIVDQTWIPDEQQQVENRAYGRARDHDVTIYYLASLGTIDEDIAVVNQQRTDSMLSVLDGQRGVNFTRQLIAMTRNRMGKKAA